MSIKIPVQTQSVDIRKQHHDRMTDISLRIGSKSVPAKASGLPVVVKPVFSQVKVLQKPQPKHHYRITDSCGCHKKFYDMYEINPEIICGFRNVRKNDEKN